MKRRRRDEPSDPPAPTNVRLVLASGEVIPLELVHVGEDAEGCAIWSSVRPIVLHDLEPVNLLADVIPARTSILVELVDERGRPL